MKPSTILFQEEEAHTMGVMGGKLRSVTPGSAVDLLPDLQLLPLIISHF